MIKLSRVRRKLPRISIHDFIAGVSLALVLVPQALAYATLAGLPVQTGLYASAIPPLAAAFFASSPYLQTGPTAVTSILVAGGLAALAVPGSNDYVLLAGLLAVIVGVIRVLVGLLRAGQIVYLMSEPVLRGFMTGAALLILFAQLPLALGLGEPPAANALTRAVWTLRSAADWDPETIVIAVAAFAVTVGAPRLHALLPGVLFATLGGILYGAATGYGGSMVGEISSGFPTPRLALPWSRLPLLVLPGVVIALVGFSEAASIARVYAARERLRWDPDSDFISQGVANLAAGLTGGLPVGGSFSRSGLAHLLNVRSRWSGAVTGVTVVAFAPFAWVLAPLPTAVLAGMVMAAVIRLVRWEPIVELWKLSRAQFMVASTTFFMTLVLSPRIDEAVILGILLAIGVHLWREVRVRVTTWSEGAALHVRPEGVLWFGSAQMLEHEVLELVAANPEARRLVLHMERLGRVDLTASLVLATVVADARAAGLETEVIAIHPMTAKALHRVLRQSQRVERKRRPATE
jgi:SulP family sulfate permease